MYLYLFCSFMFCVLQYNNRLQTFEKNGISHSVTLATDWCLFRRIAYISTSATPKTVTQIFVRS